MALRKQLGTLRTFIDGFDLAKAKPEPGRVAGGVPPGGSAQVLAEGERLFGIYLRRQTAPGAFSARWTGVLRFPTDGVYQLHVTSNDGVRVKSGARVLFEDWTDHATKTDTVTLPPASEQALPMVVEYFYGGGNGVMRLAWTRPDGVRETIPAEAWRTKAGGVMGVSATYFRGMTLKDAWFSRGEPNVDHDFGSSGPRQAETPNPFASSGALAISLPAATWAVVWTNPVTGAPIRRLHRPARRRRGVSEDAGLAGRRRRLDPARRAGPGAARPPVSMVRVELHAHTSDDREDHLPYSARELILHAAALGYGALAITLHDTAFDPAPLATLAREHGVRLIPGIERTVEGRHVLIFNVPRRGDAGGPPPRRSRRRSRRRIRAASSSRRIRSSRSARRSAAATLDAYRAVWDADGGERACTCADSTGTAARSPGRRRTACRSSATATSIACRSSGGRGARWTSS